MDWMAMMMSTCLGLVGTQQEDGAMLPIQRVVLYKHGVGYFERQGPVEGSTTVTLHFKQDQMSDVLKSLTVLDRSGGKISAIAYDSQKPADQLLSEFAFDLRNQDVRRALLEQLRGAEISAEISGRGPLQGAVIGMESRSVQQDGATVERVYLSVLTEGADVVTVDLDDLRSFRFTDGSLAAEVKRYLALLRTTHRRDEKAVDLVCDGDGGRQIFAAYTVEQPVWKATYRLVLIEPEASKNGDALLLQGWAVVDNPSDDDWTDVELSLVSGLPVSFRQDLYTPRFRERPWLEVKEDASVSFQGLEGLGAVAAKPESERRRARPQAPPALARAAPGAFDSAGSEEDSFARDFEAQPSETISREIGDLLEYRIDHRVTIPRHRSALLPIVSGKVDGGKVALYNESARAANPMSAVRLKNTTGVTLEGGPLTVLEGDTYAGESLIDTLKPDETRYVPFAVELGVKATTQYGSESERVYRVVVVHGVMRSFYKDVSKKTYAFDNKNDKARAVIVEHPRRNGYELRAPEAVEEELDRYRFSLELAPKQRGEVVVIEEAMRERSFQIGNIDADTLAVFERSGHLTDEVLGFLRRVTTMKGELAALDRDLRRIADMQNAVAADQDRIRKNLTALGSSAEEKDLRRDYVAALRADEDRVRKMKEERAEVEAQVLAKKKEVDALIVSATFLIDG